MSWTPSNQLLADGMHILLGLIAVTWAVWFGHAWYWGAILILAWGLLKELVIDRAIEHDTFLPPGTGWRDLLGYMGGAGGGFVVAMYVFPMFHV